MKYLFVTLTLLAMPWPGGVLWAQPDLKTMAGGQGPPAAARVGLVNLGVLFRDQDRVKVMKVELDRKVKPFEDKASELKKYIENWQKALKNQNSTLTQEQREKGLQVLIECRRQLQDLENEYQKEVGPQLGAQMVSMDQEIRQAIKLYAETHGYHIVLAYTVPDPPLPALSELQWRMTAIDAGNVSFVPVPASNLDITRGVLDLLNSTYRATSVGDKRK